MNKRFTLVTVALAATVAFLIGLVVAGSLTPPSVASAGAPAWQQLRPLARTGVEGAAMIVNFADIAARINPAVVNIDAASRGRGASFGRFKTPGGRPPGHPPVGPSPDEGEDPSGDDRDPDAPFEGTGSGFIIDPDGSILTNFHVIEGAERIIVTLADGRDLRATVVGTDPATDLALLKVHADVPLPAAPLGDSSRLRPGEWVCAIGNPLAYEHTVTVGVVSHLGRKLYDTSLDDYIQTDAAINFGNSGGPLINARGEVIGISAAISWRASNIGFAIPINQARAILPQLQARGRVSRGYIGVTLVDLDPDLARSLRLAPRSGALVQDVAPDSPGDRAGLRAYDVIVSIDGESVRTSDEVIRLVAARTPGSVARLEVRRDGRPQAMNVRLIERPRDEDQADDARPSTTPRATATGQAVPAALVGLRVSRLEPGLFTRFSLPPRLEGVVVATVEPMGAAEEAGIEHGDIILEINRLPVRSPADYLRILGGVKAGDVLAVYCYVPSLGQRVLRTVHVEPWQE
jgi:serine protease Do